LSAAPATRLACAACRAPAPAPFTWRCAATGTDDLDHRMARTLDMTRVTFPRDDEPDPFVRYRRLTHAWQTAHAAAMPDEEFIARVRRLEARIAAVAGKGFAETPFARADGLGARLGFESPGAVWVKDETGNVSGSHKGRHLMGLALALEISEWLDPAAAGAHRRHGLAIASCGNAALAAAVLARATDRALTAFIPTDAAPAVVARLESLGARTVVCPRTPGVPGDPTLHAFRRAIEGGAVPFCCQAVENGLTVEGGETLAWEMASALAAVGEGVDRLFVQVGGGALISACVAGLREAVALGVLPRLPRIHAVQSEGGFPLGRAYRLVARRVLEGRLDTPAEADYVTLSEIMRDMSKGPEVAAALTYAMQHRSRFMWPWEVTPRSVAHGILDDETYDWHLPVAAMIESGGHPVVVNEATLCEAAALAVSSTGIDVDETGAAGLAGALALRRWGSLGAHERVAVLFTGARR
jgi:threonine synthase